MCKMPAFYAYKCMHEAEAVFFEEFFFLYWCKITERGKKTKKTKQKKKQTKEIFVSGTLSDKIVIV